MPKSLNHSKKVKRIFFDRGVTIVAKELLGKILVKNESGKILAGKIVEVEAYDEGNDQASHSYSGRTARNEVMFGPPGYLYVYFTYGVHYCCNVVTGKVGEGSAVLIRAVEPLEGINLMARRRFGKDNLSEKEMINLTNGPAKVCHAFSIDKKSNGVDLTGDEIFLLNGDAPCDEEIGISRRIGIKKSINLPWRFFIKNNPFVLKK